MMLLAPVIGGGSALVGLYLSWSLDLPAGGTIVLVATTVFLLAWFLAPRHGLLARRRAHASARTPEEEAGGLAQAPERRTTENPRRRRRRSRAASTWPVARPWLWRAVPASSAR